MTYFISTIAIDSRNAKFPKKTWDLKKNREHLLDTIKRCVGVFVTANFKNC